MIADVPIGVECGSLREASLEEALAERWIQSYHAGRDVGEQAIRHWILRHWPGFLRRRVVQHMLGQKFWVELGRETFDLFKDLSPEKKPVLDKVIEQLLNGAENLDFARWLQCQPRDIRPIIRQLLTTININSYRIHCFFADQYLHQ